MSKNNNFIERSIVGAVSFLRSSLFADELASQKGFLQSLDPRIKTVMFLLLILAVLFAKNILVLAWLYAVCLMLALVSGIDMWFFLKRTWIFIPLFSFFVAIPAIFSFFTPGDTLCMFRIAKVEFIITEQGLAGALFFVMRVATSVSFAVLLSVTTKHFELLKVLRVLRVPQVFVLTLGMCYRYIYLYVEIIENTYCAIKSRVGNSVHYKSGQHIVSWNIAYLWQRSYLLNEEVYKAMLSRGYRGEPVVLSDFRVKAKDIISLALAAVILAGVLYFNLRPV